MGVPRDLRDLVGAGRIRPMPSSQKRIILEHFSTPREEKRRSTSLFCIYGLLVGRQCPQIPPGEQVCHRAELLLPAAIRRSALRCPTDVSSPRCGYQCGIGFASISRFRPVVFLEKGSLLGIAVIVSAFPALRLAAFLAKIAHQHRNRAELSGSANGSPLVCLVFVAMHTLIVLGLPHSSALLPRCSQTEGSSPDTGTLEDLRVNSVSRDRLAVAAVAARLVQPVHLGLDRGLQRLERAL